MIFKTFDNDVDKISAKWGIFGKSFNDIGNAISGKIKDINKNFQATDDIIGSIKNSGDGIWARLYPTKEQIASLQINIPELIDTKKANEYLNIMKQIDAGIHPVFASYQEWHDELADGEKWIAKYAQSTKGQIRSLEGVNKANQSARDAAIAHNNALKQQTLGAKAATVAMKALSVVGNMLAMYAITKLITAYSDYKEKLHDVAEEMSAQAEKSSEYVDNLLDLKTQLEEGTKSSDELTSAFKDQLEAMGYTETEIDNLIAKYNGLSGAIDEATRKALENAKTDAYVDVASASKALEIDSNGGLTTDILITDYKTGIEQLDSEIEKILSDVATKTAQQGRAWITKDDSAEGLYEYYNALKEVSRLIQETASETDNNDLLNLGNAFDPTVYGEVTEAINKLKDSAELYGDAIGRLHNADAQLELSDYLKTNDINTQEAFDNYITGIKNSTDYSESYKQVLIDVANKAFPQFSQQAKNASDTLGDFGNKTTIFKSFNDTEIGQRLQHATNLFNEGKISYKEYFNGLQTEIENVDFSHYTDSLEDAQNAAGQLFIDTTQQTAQGLTNLINSFDSNEMSVTEYIDGYLSIAETLGTLTDELQENSEAWDKNEKALSESENMNLDGVQSDLNSAIETIKSYQDSIYGLEQILSGKLELGTDEFTAQTNVIAEDLANIVSSGGEMSEEIKNYMGDSADEIAQSLTEDVSNFDIASQAIAANTNVAIQNMATSIGELFEELGKAISNFKVDLSFGVSSITMQDVDMGILGTHQLPAVTFSLEASGDSLSSIGSAISSFGKNFSENLGQYIEYPDFTIEPEGDEYVPGDDVLSNYNNQLEKLKNASGKAGKDAGEAYKDAVEKELNNLDSVISAVGGLIDDQIDHIQDQCDAAIDALERERDAIIDGLEDEKKALEDAVEAKQDQIDAIKEAREERSAELDLQKKEYELERLQNQRTRLVYSDSKGFHYEQDMSEIRDAKEAVDQAKEEIEILKIEKEISVLEDSIDNISDKIEEVNNHYDDLIAQTEQYYQSLIDGLENYKSRWEELGELKEQAEFKRQLEELGLSSVDILNMSEEAFHAFKTQYVDALDRYLQATGDGLDAVADIDLTSTVDSVSKVADATTKIDDTKVANLSSAVEGLGDTSNLDALYNVFDQLKTIITEISNTLNGVENGNGLVKALSDLGTLSLGTTGEEAIGLIGQFVALKDAIDAVTTAISGGAEGQNLPQGGAPTKQGAMTPSGSPDSGGTGGLTQAIEEQVNKAKELLPEEINLFGADEESLLSAVTKVTTAIAGGGDSEGGKKKEQSGQREGEADTSHLMGALDAQYKEAEIKIPQERDWFNELATAIELCVTHLTTMSELLQGLTTGDLQFGLVNFHAQGTVGKAFAKGTGKYKGLHSSEKNALRSEYGQPELTVYPDGKYEITTEPTISDLPKDTVIFNEEQTRRIMKNKGTVLGNAHSEGTITLANGAILQPANLGYDVDALVQSLKNNMDYIINPLSSIDKNVDTIMRTTNNISNHNTMQNVTNFSTGDIIVQGVQNVDGFAKAVKTHFPNAMLQAIHKR